MVGGEALEHGARLDDLDRLLRADQPDAGAAVALVLHEAFVLEPGQRGAYRGAAHAELASHLDLDQALAGLEAAGDDRRAQAVFGARLVVPSSAQPAPIGVHSSTPPTGVGASRIVDNLVNHRAELIARAAGVEDADRDWSLRVNARDEPGTPR